MYLITGIFTKLKDIVDARPVCHSFMSIYAVLKASQLFHCVIQQVKTSSNLESPWLLMYLKSFCLSDTICVCL